MDQQPNKSCTGTTKVSWLRFKGYLHPMSLVVMPLRLLVRQHEEIIFLSLGFQDIAIDIAFCG